MRARLLILANSLLLTFVGASSPAWATVARARAATPAHASRVRRAARPRPPSTSLGYANGGRLQNAARLESDETIRLMPGRHLHYGTDEMVGLIRRAGRILLRRHRVALSVGDVSRASGGPALHHASHQSGRDADLSFFVVDAHGRSVQLNDYVGFGRGGRAIAGGEMRFDTRRNWALVDALLTDPAAHVEHIFVSNALRALLLEHARAIHADANVIARAAEAMHQPQGASAHANHFHVRIGCPSGDAGCLEGVRVPPRRRRHARALARNEPRERHGRHATERAHAAERPRAQRAPPR